MKFKRKKIITTTIIVGFGLLTSLFFSGSLVLHKKVRSISHITRSIYDHPLTVSNKSLE